MSSKEICEPRIGTKPVHYISGVTKKFRKRLEIDGFDSVAEVLGMYLLFKKRKELFIFWLKETYGFNDMNAEKCYIFIYFYSTVILKNFNNFLE